MGTLNPSLLSPEMDKALNAAAQLLLPEDRV